MDLTFQPRYIFQSELQTFGLPTLDEIPNVMALIDAASTYVDELCGRVDGDGSGSLAYTTYSERLLLPRGRNITRTMFTPMSAVPETTRVVLAASGSAGDDNNYNTGFTSNAVFRSDGVTLSPIISASGRYGYARRGSDLQYPDLNYGANILQVASFFGGPPNFMGIDASAIDFDPRTGEIWLPAGLYLGNYTEVIVTYNSGFDPRTMPRGVKQAVAALIRNLMAKAGGVTGIKSISSGAVNVSFTEELADEAVMRFLRPFCTAVGY